MQVHLYDTPGGTFSFGSLGTLLALGNVTGVAAPNQWTFACSYDIVSLDAAGATGATGDALTMVSDVQKSGTALSTTCRSSPPRPAWSTRTTTVFPDDQQCLDDAAS